MRRGATILAKLPVPAHPEHHFVFDASKAKQVSARNDAGPSPPVTYHVAMPGAPYYAQAFSPLPGRFRMVTRLRGGAGPTHCPEPVAWRGSWRAPNGRRYRIEACEGHRPASDEGGRPSA
jgi:hypothetical protein